MDNVKEPIILNGYGRWVESLCEHYILETILFRNTSERYVTALLNCTRTKTIIIGMYDYQTDIGKLFDRRKTIRGE